MKRIVLVILLLMTGCVCVSCVFVDRLYVPKQFYGGEQLDSTVFESYRLAMAEKETEQETWDGRVFWIQSGSVYHTHEDCTYLSGKKEIESSENLQDPILAGKEKLCSRCAKRDGVSAE